MNEIPRAITRDHSSSEDVAKDESFLRLANHIYRLSGINLPPTQKNYSLLSGRISKLCRQYNRFFDFDMVSDIVETNNKKFIKDLISVMTTNTSHFFREDGHFDHLKRFLPKIIAEKQKLGIPELRVWCAAASTGQEPYTLAITIKETLANQKYKLKLLATDIDEQVLIEAKKGVYFSKDIRKVPKETLYKYFTHQKEEYTNEDLYILDKELKKSVHFATLNLTKMPYPFKYLFDVIFCRNVFIYFDDKTTERILVEFQKNLNIGGYLFLGHSEALIRRRDDLKRVGESIYRRAI